MTLQSLITSVLQLLDEIRGTYADWENRMLAKEQQVDTLIQSSHNLKGVIRISPNQRLKTQTGGAGTAPDGWATFGNLTVWQDAFVVNAGTPDSSNQSVDALQLISFMNRGGYFSNNFKVKQVTCNNSQRATIWESSALKTGGFTFGFFYKVTQGKLFSSLSMTNELGNDGQWHFFSQGTHRKSNYSHYKISADPNTVFELALPAIVAGRDFDKETWYMFQRMVQSTTTNNINLLLD